MKSLKTFSLKTLTIYTAASAVVSLENPVSVPRLGGSQTGWWPFCCSNQLAGNHFSREPCFTLLLPERVFLQLNVFLLGAAAGHPLATWLPCRKRGHRNPRPDQACWDCCGQRGRAVVGSISAVCLSVWSGGHRLPPSSLFDSPQAQQIASLVLTAVCPIRGANRGPGPRADTVCAFELLLFLLPETLRGSEQLWGALQKEDPHLLAEPGLGPLGRGFW